MKFYVDLSERQRAAILDAMEEAWDELNARSRIYAWNAVCNDDDEIDDDDDSVCTVELSESQRTEVLRAIKAAWPEQGRSAFRTAVHMAVLSAAQSEPDFESFRGIRTYGSGFETNRRRH